MMTPLRLQEILDDLYALDPGLRGRETELRSLIVQMASLRPDAPIDDRFLDQLKNRLMTSMTKTSQNTFLHFLTGRPMRYLVPGLAAMALVAMVSFAPRHASAPAGRTSGIARVGTEAFGRLGIRPSSAGDGAAAAAGSGTLQEATTLAPAAASMGAKLLPADWTPTYYKYVYEGGEITDLAANVDVYRRAADVKTSLPASALRGLDIGLMDLAKLRRPSVGSFTLIEDGREGYVVNVDAFAGTISMRENSEWDRPERQCRDQACLDAQRLKEGDMPSASEAIKAADDFLAKFGISKEGYGTPSVRDDWRPRYLAAADKEAFWLPDTVTVVYPYVADGKNLADESGSPYGLNVEIDARRKQAVGLSNLTARRFESSSYPAATDAKRLIAIAERGGLFGSTDIPRDAKVVEIRLGKPTVVNERVWRWDGVGGSELFAPALVFPVIDPPEGFVQAGVSVPLAEELLKTDDASAPTPLILMNK